MKLRPYQSDCLTATDLAFDSFDRVLDTLPTGAGKTIIFSHIAAQRWEGRERTLILAHRDELISQAVDKIRRATGIQAEVEKAESRASLGAPVVVASVQSMIRRLDRWPKDHFGLTVCDEADLCLADSWQTVLKHFDSQVLGVTATPDRGDKRNLGQFFQTVGYEISLFELIRQGYLSPISIKSIPLQIDISKVRSGMDGDSGCVDFSRQGIADAIEPYLEPITEAIKFHAGGRRTLAFLPLIATSRKFVAMCNAKGINARHVDGESPNRRELLDGFANDEFQLLSNAMLLTRGYDIDSEPTGIGVDCVVCLRPTRSRSLYAQIVGRGTRTAAMKDNLLLLDFLWMHERHSIVRPASLISHDEVEAAEITEVATELSGAMPGEVAMDLPLVDLQKVADLTMERRLQKELEKQKHREATTISPEEMAAFYHDGELAGFEPTMESEKRPVSVKQREWLERARFDDNGKVYLYGSPKGAKPLDVSRIQNEGHASKVLNALFNKKNQGVLMASPAQKAKMGQMGHANAANATADEAKRFFAQLRKKEAVMF